MSLTFDERALIRRAVNEPCHLALRSRLALAVLIRGGVVTEFCDGPVGSEARCPTCHGYSANVRHPNCPDYQNTGRAERVIPDAVPDCCMDGNDGPGECCGHPREVPVAGERAIPATDLREFMHNELAAALATANPDHAAIRRLGQRFEAWLDVYTAKAPSGGER